MRSTLFLPGLRQQLGRLVSRCSSLRSLPLSQLELVLAPLLPLHLLSPNDDGVHSRQRCFSLRRTFFGFLWQVLNPDASCREALRHLQGQSRLQEHQTSDSEDTSAYCQARQRLPWERLDQIFRHTAALAEQRVADGQRWLGRTIKIVDGTTFSMPDTPENQSLYPQESQQKPGCGFPLLRMVGIISLGSGALLDYSTFSQRSHDIQLFNELRPHLRPGDIILGDRGFSSYTQIALLRQAEVDSVFRLHQGPGGTTGLHGSFQVIKKLRSGDWLVHWTKSKEKPKYMSLEDWAKVPDSLTVRIIHWAIKGGRTRTTKIVMVTTLLDWKKFSRLQIAELYLQRWRIELTFRELKILLRMDVLRCKSPEMIQKEIALHFIAYNLIRLLMQEAAIVAAVPLERISFKGSLDTVRQYVPSLGSKRSPSRIRILYTAMLKAIARDHVPFRPNRREPRAVKRRPKNHQFLTAPRQVFRELPHRGKYPNRASA